MRRLRRDLERDELDIRSAMIARYGAGTPALQKSCANGETPVTSCPGNRRWAQLMFDSFPLMTFSPVSRSSRATPCSPRT